jgi:hypothetical protein
MNIPDCGIPLRPLIDPPGIRYEPFQGISNSWRDRPRACSQYLHNRLCIQKGVPAIGRGSCHRHAEECPSLTSFEVLGEAMRAPSSLVPLAPKAR